MSRVEQDFVNTFGDLFGDEIPCGNVFAAIKAQCKFTSVGASGGGTEYITFTREQLEGKTVRGILEMISEAMCGVCLAFGIKPIITKNGQGRNLAYNEWENKKRGTSWKEKIRLEIDRLIGTVKNLDELLSELEALGYTIKKGKYISIKAPEQERFVRTKTLGETLAECAEVAKKLRAAGFYGGGSH